jgi:hypothetical protein
MYKRVNRKSDNSSQSALSHPNRFAPRTFQVPAVEELPSQSTTPESPAEGEKIKQSESTGNFPDVSLFTNHPARAATPRLQMKLRSGQRLNPSTPGAISAPQNILANRAGLVIQRVEKPPVQVESFIDRVTMVNTPLTDRPEGVFKGDEKSHTTSQAVFGEMVRQTVNGKSFDQAIAAMDGLLNETMNLPGVSRVDAMSYDRQVAYAQAKKRVETAKDAATASPNQNTLQRYISAFLAYRNIIPLSAVDIGALADSGGEPANLKIVRNPSSHPPEVIRNALLGLLDLKAVAKISSPDIDFEDDETADWDYSDVNDVDLPDNTASKVSLEVPGARQDEEVEDRVADVVNQHLTTVARAFPQAYKKSGLTEEHVLDYLGMQSNTEDNGYDSEEDFGSKRGRKSKSNAGKNSKRLKKKEERNVGGDRNVVESALSIPEKSNDPQTSGTKNNPSTVQVILKSDGTIKEVGISSSDRPHGLFGGADKKHSTAWTVFVQGVQAGLKGKTIDAAIAVMDGFYNDAKALPGVALTANLTQKRADEFKNVQIAVGAAQTFANSNKNLNNLQGYIRAFLAYRNFIPLSAADIPGHGTGAKNEGDSMAILMDHGNNTADDLRDAMWGLLDHGVVKGFGNLKGMNQGTNLESRNGNQVNPDLPGADLNSTPKARIVAVIKQHLLTLKSLHQDAFNKSGVGTKDSILAFLNDNDIGEPGQNRKDISDQAEVG